MPKSHIPRNVPADFEKEVKSLSNNPRAQIVVTCGFLELLVNTIIAEKCRHGKKIASSHRDFPLSVKLVLLNELGLIDDEWFERLDWIRDIRNKAAHRAVFEITTDHWKTLDGLGVIPKNWSTQHPQFVGSICTNLVFGFWLLHAETFGRVLPY
jgi:hypothetical protein